MQPLLGSLTLQLYQPSSRPVPRMRRVDRASTDIVALPDAGPLLALDIAIVVTLAGRLPVLSIPEQLLIALMRNAVVHHRGRFCSAFAFAALTQWVSVEKYQSLALPLRTVASLSGLALVVSPRWRVRPTRHRHPQTQRSPRTSRLRAQYVILYFVPNRPYRKPCQAALSRTTRGLSTPAINASPSSAISSAPAAAGSIRARGLRCEKIRLSSHEGP